MGNKCKLKALRTTDIQVGYDIVSIKKGEIYNLPAEYITRFPKCFEQFIETTIQRNKRLKQELVEAETNRVKAKTS